MQGSITLLNNAAYPQPRALSRALLKGGVATVTTEPLGELSLLDLNSTDRSFYPGIDKRFSKWHDLVVTAKGSPSSRLADFTSDPPSQKEIQTFLSNEREFWTLMFFFPNSPVFPLAQPGSAVAIQIQKGNAARMFRYLVGFAYFRAIFEQQAEIAQRNIEATNTERALDLAEKLPELKKRLKKLTEKLKNPVGRQRVARGNFDAINIFAALKETEAEIEAEIADIETEVAKAEELPFWQNSLAASVEALRDLDAALSAKPSVGDPKPYKTEYDKKRYDPFRDSPHLVAAQGLQLEETLSENLAQKVASLALYRALRTLDEDVRNAVAKRAIFEMKVPTGKVETFKVKGKTQKIRSFNFRASAELVLASLDASCAFNKDEPDEAPEGIPISESVTLNPGEFTSRIHVGPKWGKWAFQLADQLDEGHQSGGTPGLFTYGPISKEFPGLAFLILKYEASGQQGRIVVAKPTRDRNGALEKVTTKNSDYYTLITKWNANKTVETKITYAYRPDDDDGDIFEDAPALPGDSVQNDVINTAIRWTHPILGVVVLPKRETLDAAGQLFYNNLKIFAGCTPRYVVPAVSMKSGCLYTGPEPPAPESAVEDFDCSQPEFVEIPEKGANVIKIKPTTKLTEKQPHVLYYTPCPTTLATSTATDNAIDKKEAELLRKHEKELAAATEDKAKAILEEKHAKEVEKFERKATRMMVNQGPLRRVENRPATLLVEDKDGRLKQTARPGFEMETEVVGEFSNDIIWTARVKFESAEDAPAYVGIVVMSGMLAVIHAFSVYDEDGRPYTRTWSDAFSTTDPQFPDAVDKKTSLVSAAVPRVVTADKLDMTLDVAPEDEAGLTARYTIPKNWIGDRRDGEGNLVFDRVVFHFTTITATDMTRITQTSRGPRTTRAIRNVLAETDPQKLLEQIKVYDPDVDPVRDGTALKTYRKKLVGILTAREGKFAKDEAAKRGEDTDDLTFEENVASIYKGDASLYCYDKTANSRANFNMVAMRALEQYAGLPNGGYLPAFVNREDARTLEERVNLARQQATPWHVLCKSASASTEPRNLAATESPLSAVYRDKLFSSFQYYITDPLEYLGAALQLRWYSTFWKHQHETLLGRLGNLGSKTSDWSSEFVPGGLSNNNEFLARHKWYDWCSTQMLQIAGDAEKKEARRKGRKLKFEVPTDLLSAFFETAPCAMIGVDTVTKIVIGTEPKSKTFLEEVTNETTIDTVDAREEFSKTQIKGFNEQFTLPEDIKEIQVFVRESEFSKSWKQIRDDLLVNATSKKGNFIGRAYTKNQLVLVELVENLNDDFEPAPEETVENLINSGGLNVPDPLNPEPGDARVAEFAKYGIAVFYDGEQAVSFGGEIEDGTAIDSFTRNSNGLLEVVSFHDRLNKTEFLETIGVRGDTRKPRAEESSRAATPAKPKKKKTKTKEENRNAEEDKLLEAVQRIYTETYATSVKEEDDKEEQKRFKEINKKLKELGFSKISRTNLTEDIQEVIAETEDGLVEQEAKLLDAVGRFYDSDNPPTTFGQVRERLIQARYSTRLIDGLMPEIFAVMNEILQNPEGGAAGPDEAAFEATRKRGRDAAAERMTKKQRAKYEEAEEQREKRRAEEAKAAEESEKRQRAGNAENANVNERINYVLEGDEAIAMFRIRLHKREEQGFSDEFASGCDDFTIDVKKTLPNAVVIAADIVDQATPKPECSVWLHALMHLFSHTRPYKLPGYGNEFNRMEIYMGLAELPFVGPKIRRQQELLDELAENFTLTGNKRIPYKPKRRLYTTQSGASA